VPRAQAHTRGKLQEDNVCTLDVYKAIAQNVARYRAENRASSLGGLKKVFSGGVFYKMKRQRDSIVVNPVTKHSFDDKVLVVHGNTNNRGLYIAYTDIVVVDPDTPSLTVDINREAYVLTFESKGVYETFCKDIDPWIRRCYHQKVDSSDLSFLVDAVAK
jgi:hypothetical protein